MLGMTGLLNAQTNLKMASIVQHVSNQTVSAGRILVGQGAMSGNAKAVEKGLALQEEGEEKRVGVFEYLDKAMEDVKIAANEIEETAKESENTVHDSEKTEGEESSEIIKSNSIFDVVVGDDAEGSENIRLPASDDSAAVYNVKGNKSVPAANQNNKFNISL